MTDSAHAPVRRTGYDRVREVLGSVAADVTVGVVWAALVVAIVVFSGVVSQFAYVDF